MSRRKPISPPLPLPTRFTLLPSLLPTKALVPLLYSELDGIPIYLTLSPSHEPYICLLPLLLTLVPSSPLHIIKQLPLGSISLDLAGNAPYIDLWAPLPLARRLFSQLGVLHLFRLEGKSSGLLSNEAEQMISWEEHGCICHNWIPSSSSIPPSAYSLEILLNTPFGQVDIIPDERCVGSHLEGLTIQITTSLGRSRHAALIAAGEFGDHSRIRHGEWSLAWDECLTWTLSAWSEYSAYPSRPPKDRFAHDPAVERVHRLLPRLGSLSGNSHHLDHPLSAADIAAAMHLIPVHQPPLTDLTYQLISRLYRLLPFARLPQPSADRRQLERRARVQLGVVEMVGSQLVEIVMRERSRIDESGLAKAGRGSSHLTDPLAPNALDITNSSPADRNRDTSVRLPAPRKRSGRAVSTTSGSPSRSDPRSAGDSQPPALRDLQSGAVEGWWIYLAITGSIVLALIFGLLPV